MDRTALLVLRAGPIPLATTLGLISSRNWMSCAEHGNSGKHEQANGLLHRNAAVERHRVFSVTSGRLRALEECAGKRRVDYRWRLRSLLRRNPILTGESVRSQSQLTPLVVRPRPSC